jgi:ATP-binding cassette, subfamily B, multidrug efflux pump
MQLRETETMFHNPQYDIGKEENLARITDIRFIRRMLAYAKPYRFFIILTVLIMLLSALANIAQPYLLKIAIDKYIILKDIKGLQSITLLYMLMLFAEFALFYIQMWLLQYTGQKIIFDIRQAIFGHLQKMSIRFFDLNPVGRLVTRVTNDTEAIKDMYTDVLVHFCGDIFLLLSIMGIMLFLHWRLALVVFTVIPFLFFVTWFYRRRAREAFREIRTKLAQINAALQENIAGIRVIQAFNNEGKKYHDFEQINHSHYLAGLKELKTFAVFRPFIDLIYSATIALILWYGGGAVIQHSIEIGTLFAFVNYTEKFFWPIKDLAEKYNILQSALAGAERVFGLMDEQCEPQDTQSPMTLPVIQGKIEFNNVWFAYNEPEWILKDVSFTIEPGNTVALVGPTGAGKTTIINLINRMYEIQKGKILIDGIDIRRIQQADLRSLIGVVFQETFLFTGTIADNIRLGNDSITDDDVRKAARQVNAEPFIQRLPEGYNTKLQQHGTTLSFGQKQLLSFARTLAFNRPILVLDEATANIDTETEALIQYGLEKLSERRTTIVIAHRLSTVQKADNIVVIHKGRIAEVGTHQQLLTRKGIYYRLYQLQYQQ